MRWVRPSGLAVIFYHDALFRKETDKKILVLTFDDGPDPESTPGVLKLLGDYGIKAIFFCNGRNAEKYPDLMAQINSEGHIIGNHGNLHLNGWKTTCREYCENVYSSAELTSDKLFRPPYGKMTRCQFRTLKKDFRIVMWDLMPYDFDSAFGAEKSLALLNKYIRPGSIIVLHDSPDSTFKEFLRDFIENSIKTGYRFEVEI